MGKGTITTAQTRFHLDGSVSGRNTLDRLIPAYHLESTKTGRSSLDRATPAEIIHIKSTTFGRGALDCATLAKIFYHVEGTTSGRNWIVWHLWKAVTIWKVALLEKALWMVRYRRKSVGIWKVPFLEGIHSIAPVKIIHLEGTTSGRSALDRAIPAKILYHVEGTTSRRSALDRANLLPSGKYHLWKERSGPRHTRGNPFQ
jgi:hypothetical protein